MKSHYCATKKEVYKLLFNYHIILCKKRQGFSRTFLPNCIFLFFYHCFNPYFFKKSLSAIGFYLFFSLFNVSYETCPPDLMFHVKHSKSLHPSSKDIQALT